MDEQNQSNMSRLKVGRIVALAILLLETLSIFFSALPQTTELSSALWSFGDKIKSASGFICVICISYAFTLLTLPKKPILYVSLFLVDWILASRIYANHVLWDIPSILLSWSLNRWIVTVVFFTLFGFCLYYWDYVRPEQPPRRRTMRRNTEQSTGNEPRLFHNNAHTSESNMSSPLYNSGFNSSHQDVSHTITTNGDNENGEEYEGPLSVGEIVLHLVKFFTVALIMLCGFDYLVNDALPETWNFNVHWPVWFPPSEALRFAAIIGIVLWFTSPFIRPIITPYTTNKRRRRQMNEELQFYVSALLAIVLLIIILFLTNRVENPGDVTNKLISIVTGDGPTTIFTLVVLFLVCQILVVIVMHLFGFRPPKGSVTYDVADKLRSNITTIELKIIEIACGVLVGCVSLFSFIPDFFETIGELLLDKKSESEGVQANEGESLSEPDE